MRRIHGTFPSLAFLLVVACTVPIAVAQAMTRFDVPAEPLADALRAIGGQAKINVLFDPPLVEGHQAPALKANLTIDQALTRLLAGTGIKHEFLNDTTVVLAAPASTTDTGAVSPPPPGVQPTPVTEGSKSPSDRLRLAQADQGTSADLSTVEKQENQASKKQKGEQLEEVVVTGSRLRQSSDGASQKVDVYTSEAIDRSGQTTLGDFLNTIPQVSTVTDPSGFQTGGTSVRLHGLPLGTTLVLIDGHRVADPGGLVAGSNIFDLSNIPVAAVDRVDIVPVGSSAVYGSDGIAGVVNIILKKDFSGFEGSVKYGAASGTNATTTSLAWGSLWDKGSFSIVGSYQTTSELLGADRALTANNNYTALGGSDNRYYFANPGNVFSIDGSNLPGLNAPYAAVPAGFKGPPSPSEFTTTAGSLNKFSFYSGFGLIPRSNQGSVVMSARQNITSLVQLFGQLLYSQRRQFQDDPPPSLFGQPGFQSFTASASNPFNPFGQTVGVAYLFPNPVQRTDYQNDFLQPTAGLRGTFLKGWNWELSGSWSDETDRAMFLNQINSTTTQDALNSSNPATALDPFVVGPPGSSALLEGLFYNLMYRFRSTRTVANAFVNGPLGTLPWGDVDVVLGTEYSRDNLTSSQENPTNPTAGNPLNTDSPSVGRSSSAGFAEARVPLLPKGLDGRDSLVMDLAARYDHFSDIGSKTTPQVGLLWRPFDTVTLRGTWGKAFKAPSLYQLHEAQNSFPYPGLIDPTTNQPVVPTVTSGGSPTLKPELGQSHSFEIQYACEAIPGLEIEVSQWRIDETNSIQTLPPQVIINNANLFPGAVTRAARCGSGAPCPIIAVDDTFTNFGDINVQGVDYEGRYKVTSKVGEWSAAVNIAQIYHYAVAFLPGLPATDRAGIANEDLNWAPRWKSAVTAGWSTEPFKVSVTGRYTGKYRDYDPLADGSYQSLGNFWLCDFNARLDMGHAFGSTPTWLRRGFAEIGAVNLFNRAPQFSTLSTGAGYDYLQADVRGRFLYARFGMHL
jgi:iron complex outermembrane receptor protein